MVMKEREFIRDKESFLWVDVTMPNDQELSELAERFNLHKTAILDCLEPEHLPKREQFPEMAFLILRAFDRNTVDQSIKASAATPQQLTRKIAIFLLKNTVLTIHRAEMPFFKEIEERWKNPTAQHALHIRLLGDIMRAVIDSYEVFISEMNRLLSDIEARTFENKRTDGLFDEGYFLRRRAYVCSYLLGLTNDVFRDIDEIIPKQSLPYFNRIHQKSSRLSLSANDILTNVDNILSLHLSILAKKSNDSSAKTNEIMRFLTVFSAFFLPLNFIASIYGMNFEHMPELSHPLGYYRTLAFMIVIGVAVILYFRSKGYLNKHD